MNNFLQLTVGYERSRKVSFVQVLQDGTEQPNKVHFSQMDRTLPKKSVAYTKGVDTYHI